MSVNNTMTHCQFVEVEGKQPHVEYGTTLRIKRHAQRVVRKLYRTTMDLSAIEELWNELVKRGWFKLIIKSMNEERAVEILGKGLIEKDNSLRGDGEYFYWRNGEKTACLDGDFTADELEAIAWWMRNK